jgi:hypothetical protein
MTLQFSMRTFVIVIALLAVGFACVAASRPLASNAVYTLNWMLMCLSLVAAMVLRGPRQLFWLGFAVFAWCYWYTGAEPASDNLAQRVTMLNRGWYVSNIGTVQTVNPARLLSGAFIDLLEARVHPHWSVGDAVTAQYSGGGYYPGLVDDVQNGRYLIRWTDGSSSPREWVLPGQIQPGTSVVRVAANSLVCSLWGLIGGLLASALFGVRKAKPNAEQRPLAPAVDEGPNQQHAAAPPVP